MAAARIALSRHVGLLGKASPPWRVVRREVGAGGGIKGKLGGRPMGVRWESSNIGESFFFLVDFTLVSSS